MTDGKTTILPGTYLEVTSRIHGPAGLLRPSVAAILAERKADEGISPVEVPPQVLGPARDGDIYKHVAAVGTASFATGNHN